MGRLFNDDGSRVVAPTAQTGGGRIKWGDATKSRDEYNKKKKRQDELDAISSKSSKIKYSDRIKTINDAAKEGAIDKKTQLDLINRTIDQENPEQLSSTDKRVLALGDTLKGLGAALTQGYKPVGEGTAEVLNEISGNAQKERDRQAKTQRDDAKLIRTYGERIKNAKTEDEKNRYRSALSKLTKTGDDSDSEFRSRQSEIAERTDPLKGAGAIASIGLDIATAGVGGATIKGLRTAQTAKQALKETAKRAGQGAGVGAGYGATSTLEDKGKEATFEDFTRNIAIGAGIGGALPIAGRGAKAIKETRPIQAADKFISNTRLKASESISNKVSNTKVGKVITRGIEKTQQALVDSLQPVLNDFKGLVDKDGRKISENVRQLATNVSRSSALTDARLKANPAWQELSTLLEPAKTRLGSRRAANKETDEIGKFINAKQDAINNNKLNPKKKVEVPVGTDKQERAYELLNQTTKNDIQFAFDNQLISEANYKKYMADDNYTRVQRDMSDALESAYRGTGGPDASISSTTLMQRLKGSKRKALDPFAAHLDWSDKITRDVERRRLSSYIIEQRQANGLGKDYLRKADDVIARKEAAGEAAQLRVLRNGLGKAVKSEAKYGRRLEQELNSLSKKGKDLSIKGAGSSKTAKPRSGFKAQIDTLIKTSTPELKRIRKKVAAREPRLAKHIDNLIGLKQQHEIAAKAVKELTDLARSKGDTAATNKATIKTFTKGVKEVWEDEPRIVDAINKVGRVELNAYIRAAQFPSKVIQRTATALNPVFTASNLVRDQVSSAINSKDIKATHNPISFMMGLKEAVLKPTGKAVLRGVGARKKAEKSFNPSKEYEKFLSRVAGSTRTDITREMKNTTRRSRELLGLKGDTFLRKAENINSATENLTRFQNYYGTYKKDIRKGLDSEVAEKNALQAARENSVDFERSGDLAPYLKIFNPFANANIQGSRSLARAFTERPIGTSLKVAATIMAPIAASTYYNLSDPNRALIYGQLSDSDRDQNLIFITEEGKVLKVPLPPGVREMGAPVRGLIEAEYGEGYDPQSFLQTAASLFIDPYNPTSLGWGEAVPQFARPGVEANNNFSFFRDEAIVPEYLQDKPVEEQTNKGISQSYEDIAKALNMSPLIVKSLITGYTSSVGEQSISLVDKGRKASGQDVKTDKRDTLSQLKGKFYEDKPDQNQAANRTFFKAYDIIKPRKDRVSKEVGQLVRSGKLSEAKRKAEDFNKSIGGTFDVFEKNYGTQNKDISRDEMWDEMKNDLEISTSDRAFKARLKQ